MNEEKEINGNIFNASWISHDVIKLPSGIEDVYVLPREELIKLIQKHKFIAVKKRKNYHLTLIE